MLGAEGSPHTFLDARVAADINAGASVRERARLREGAVSVALYVLRAVPQQVLSNEEGFTGWRNNIYEARSEAEGVMHRCGSHRTCRELRRRVCMVSLGGSKCLRHPVEVSELEERKRCTCDRWTWCITPQGQQRITRRGGEVGSMQTHCRFANIPSNLLPTCTWYQ